MTRMTRPVAGNGDEQNVFTGWRRVYRFRAGEIKRIKRRANKRDRRDAKKECRP